MDALYVISGILHGAMGLGHGLWALSPYNPKPPKCALPCQGDLAADSKHAYLIFYMLHATKAIRTRDKRLLPMVVGAIGDVAKQNCKLPFLIPIMGGGFVCNNDPG